MCYCAYPTTADENNRNIYLPQLMIQDVMWWYHMILGHRGVTRVYNTI